MDPLQYTLRKTRLIHAVFLSTIVLYVFCLSLVKPITVKASPGLVLVLSVEAFVVALVAFSVRKRSVRPAQNALRLNPEDTRALAQWRLGTIASLAMCENLPLMGFLLRIFGASWELVGLFFVTGALLMLVWRPRLDLPPGN